jgi:hypothetical protein
MTRAPSPVRPDEVSCKSLPFKSIQNYAKFSSRTLYDQSLPPTKPRSKQNCVSVPMVNRSILKKRGFNHRKRLRVHFNETTNVQLQLRKTPEDIQNCWYNRNEYVAFDNDRKRTVHMIQRAYYDFRYLNPAEHTIIGLENYIYGKEQMILRKMRSVRHVRCVLRQQYNNRCYFTKTGYSDMLYSPSDVLLRYESQLFSKHPTSCAYNRGVLDPAVF